jgi:ABC-type polysaccharide/polyol phosphate transport system ATPase subunit
MDNVIIRLQNISKVYKMYKHPTDRLKESLSIRKRKYHSDFNALDNVTFSINKGENVGIIGKNGSGKSTLLKIITGIIPPTTGDVQVFGRVSAILELGAGFNPEYSGVENIFIYGMIMGISRKEMQLKLEEIIQFAELGDFINQPVKTYSSGMYARLAFSVAINIDPDLLIVDEALSVGDMGFQHKCMNKMKELIDRGVTILFVSHDTFAVKSLCTRCIYLENGEVKADGNSIAVTDLYLMDIRKKIYTAEAEDISSVNQNIVRQMDNEENQEVSDSNESQSIEDSQNDKDSNYESLRYGTGDVRIKKVTMRNEHGSETDHFHFGETMTLEIELHSFIRIEHLNCCIRIRDKNGIDITGTTTFEENIVFPTIKAHEKIKVLFTSANLLKHDMTFSVGVTINDTKHIADQTILDHIDVAYTFKSVYNPKRPVWYMYYQDYDIKYEISQ